MLLKLADRDDAMTHTHFHEKLAEAGLGFVVPVFFVASGLRESTTLSFVLIASQIGQELGLLSASDTAALTAAALVSVLVSRAEPGARPRRARRQRRGAVGCPRHGVTLTASRYVPTESDTPRSSNSSRVRGPVARTLNA